MKKIIDGMIRVQQAIAFGLMVVVVGATFMQVVARFVFDSPFAWTDELARFGYVWMTFIAAAAVMGLRGHLTVELGDRKLPTMVKSALNIFAALVVIGCCAVLASGSFGMLGDRAEGHSTALGLPLSVFYGVIWVSFILMGFHALVNLIQLIMIMLQPGDSTPDLEALTTTDVEEML